jgi:hypothetical protein
MKIDFKFGEPLTIGKYTYTFDKNNHSDQFDGRKLYFPYRREFGIEITYPFPIKHAILHPDGKCKSYSNDELDRLFNDEIIIGATP